MVDHATVCCMCGDVGFPDKLFRCCKCHHRLQHSYCSSQYSELAEPVELCDWCRSEEKSTRQISSSSKKSSSVVAKEEAAAAAAGSTNRSEYSSGVRIKQHGSREEGGSSDKGKAQSGTPSPRPTTRRYKLLKDVMC